MSVLSERVSREARLQQYILKATALFARECGGADRPASERCRVAGAAIAQECDRAQSIVYSFSIWNNSVEHFEKSGLGRVSRLWTISGAQTSASR